MGAGLEPAAFEQVLAHMAESVAIYERDSRVVYVNPAAERMFGSPSENLVGHRLWDLYPGTIDTKFRAAFERVADGGGPDELDHYCPTFARWWGSTLRLVDGRVHVVGREVTEQLRWRRRVEALARISEALVDDDLELDQLYRAVANILTECLEAECSIALLSDDRQWLELKAMAARDPETLALARSITRFSATTGHPGEALRRRSGVLATPESMAMHQAQVTDAELKQVVLRMRPSSLVVVPLLVGEDAIGVLMAVRRSEPPLTDEDLRLATETSASIGLHLAHARRRAEANSLRRRLAAVTDSNPALVSLVDRDRRYVYVNKAYERWYRRPVSDFTGHRLDEFMGPQAYAAIEPYVDQALAGEEVHYKVAIPRPAGETGERYIDARYVPLRDERGVVEGFSALVLDLTAEHRLEEAEQRRVEEERRATRRLESLLALTGRLAGAAREDEIGQILVDEGVAAIGASLAALWLRGDDGFVLVREHGMRPEHATAFAKITANEATPFTDCVHSNGQPVWVESRAEYAARYPAFEPLYRPNPAPPLAFGLLPLVIEQQCVGVVMFAFHDERRLTRDDRTYLELLSSHGAQALRRARLYAQLRDVSETREAMIQASPGAILLLDDNAVVHAWNPAAERIFGWTAAEAIGHFLPWAALERRDQIVNSLRDVLAGRPIHDGRMRWPRRNGDFLDIELYAVPVRTSDGRTRCLAIAFDITQRMRVERGRELVAEASAILSRSLDPDETMRQLIKLPLDYFAEWCSVDLLTDDGMLDRLAQSREDATFDAIPRRLAHSSSYGGSSAAIATRSPVVMRDLAEDDLRKVARDEEHFEALRAIRMRSTLSLPLLVGDRLLGSLNLASRTRNYDDLDVAIFGDLASRAATAIENAQLYRAAQTARRAAEAADHAKDQFLAMLGHELRNPLAPITTALHLMKMRSPGVAERERAVIERQVSHLTQLVDDLLDVSRITRGKIELARERVAVGAIIGRALEITSPLFEQRRHRLTIDVPQELVVEGDPLRLGQVVANLLSNAAKYTDTAGQIEIGARRTNGHVVLTVRDNGIGIAPDMLPTVFEAFVQAPQPSARTAGGLGLGLAIVKSIVELHGGSVRAISEGVGCGTLIEVTLPAASGDIVHGEAVPALQGRRPGRRILVVDDNRDAATMLTEVLETYGHTVATAYDGPTALKLAEEVAPEIAILDIGLPVMDGYELADRLRAQRPIRLIAVTGYGQPSDRERARAAGFEAHVAKPVSIERLVDLVDNPSDELTRS